MAYTTDLDGIGVIDDSNADEYKDELDTLTGACGSGFQARDFNRYGVGTYAPVSAVEVYPRSQWDDLIKKQEDNHTSPYHHHKASNAPILDQNGHPYCWMFGVAAGVMNNYASHGIEVPYLCATAPAAQGKNYRQQGGWGGEAIKYIRQYGIPTVDTWPQGSLNRKYANDHEQKLDAARHGVVDFEEIPSKNFDMCASVLLDPINPSPVSLALMWWGHLVCGLRLVKIDRNSYGILIVNSWKKTWGDGGFKVLTESKSTAHEHIAIRDVKLRAA